MENTNENTSIFNSFESGKDKIILENKQHWREIGFWCALHSSENLNNEFSNLIQEYEANKSEQRQYLELRLKEEIARFERKIEIAATKNKQIENEIEKQKNVTEIEKTILDAKQEKDTLELELAKFYNDLGRAKKDLLENQIKEAFKNLESIIENYGEITEKHKKISLITSHENEKALRIVPDFLLKLRDNYQDTYDKMQKRISNLSMNGVMFFSRSKLIGYATALASGYFFSIFALQKQLSNEDVPFFMLTGLFGFGEALKNSESFWFSLLNHILFIALSLVSIFVVTFICQFFLKKHEEGQEIHNFFRKFLITQLKNYSESDEDSNSKQQESDFPNETLQSPSTSLWTFWLEIIPFLLIAGIVFIVLSLGNVGTELTGTSSLDKLSISLSAQVVGVALSLGFAGLTYLYIINVIEPRLERKRRNDQPINWLYNFELILVIFVILVSMLLLLFGVENTFFQSTTDIFSFSMFFICILLSSFTLGYGVYYRGLAETIENLEFHMNKLSFQTAFTSVPNIPSILKADRKFRDRYFEIVNRILGLVAAQAKVAEKSVMLKPQTKKRIKTKQSRKQPKFNINNVKDFVYNMFTEPPPPDLSKQNKIEEEIDKIEQRFETRLMDKDLFPDLMTEVENLKGQIKTIVENIVDLELDVKNRLESNTEFIKRLNDEEKDLNQKIDDWYKHILTLQDNRLSRIEEFNNRKLRDKKHIKDGFNLGLWFLEHDIKPTPRYITNQEVNDERYQQ